MKKPMILLSSQTMPMEAPFQKFYHYTNAFNTEAIRQAGGIPVVVPLLSQEDALDLMERADGLFLTGGEDLSPALYGETPLAACGKTDPRRDENDLHLLRAALRLEKPILAVCRGFQLVNAFFGGKLYQDLPTQHPTEIAHSLYPEYDRPTAHSLALTPGSPLEILLQTSEISVNSLHHQAISVLAPALSPMALAPDGIVEGFYKPGPFLWGLQWHPEMLDRPESRKILAAFLSACQRSAPSIFLSK